ncbi:major facilitator superfamily [Heterobasidion irregulare TC 32-1]|uniref:Major facilitator superfamily n=1 Tax=Heterobasidion irregulare (strain TC 32-1) TaxID=747525 RepID=W4KBD2_HETIT|nr:major facilitator superfamily [Heterobasidion irregulare TC 32-1]ETW83108.1 major facilitator superfamily [Heterobasidion irregulare TC 32-1]
MTAPGMDSKDSSKVVWAGQSYANGVSEGDEVVEVLSSSDTRVTVGGSEGVIVFFYSYAYGPKGLAGLWHNSYACGCAIFASIGGLTFGYDQGVIANVLIMQDFMQRWPIGPWEKGLMTAVLELGALFGALMAGISADRFSRRTSMVLACAVFCIGSALQCWAESLSHVVLGRAIGGFGIGALSMLSPLYMAEISPPEVRGSLMSLEQFSIVLGCVIGFWTGFFTRNSTSLAQPIDLSRLKGIIYRIINSDVTVPGSASWRIPLGLQLVPGLLLAFGSFLLPPSPRLLVYQGKNRPTASGLPNILHTHDIEFLEMQVEANLIYRMTGTDDKNSFRNEARSWVKLFDRRYLDRTLIGIMIMFFQRKPTLIYYGPLLLRSLGLTGNSVDLLVAGGINIVQLVAVLPAIVYIDQWGRKPLLRAGSAVMTISHLLVSLLIYEFSGHWAEHRVAAAMSVGCLYLFMAAYGISFGPVGWVLPSEVFPLSMRSKGVSLSTASVWSNNFLVGLVTPGLMEISASGTFMVFACACFAAYLWSTYVVPETANISLEEIDAVFRSSVGQEDAQLKSQIERDLGLHDLVRELAAREH